MLDGFWGVPQDSRDVGNGIAPTVICALLLVYRTDALCIAVERGDPESGERHDGRGAEDADGGGDPRPGVQQVTHRSFVAGITLSRDSIT